VKRPLYNLLATLSLLLGVISGIVWITNITSVMRGPRHLAGMWSFQACDSPFWEISLAIFHDSPVPNAGPPFSSGPPYSSSMYTPTVMAWYDKTIPPQVYHGTAGFECTVGPHLEINRTRSLVLAWRGRLANAPHMVQR